MSEPEGRGRARSEPAGRGRPRILEQGYRRLLAWYPEPFRSRREDEMLAVLLASARPGQRRPSMAEAADVIRSALGMRLRRLLSGHGRQDRADALAVFSLVAPLFLVAISALEVALPYRFSLPAGPDLRVWVERALGSHPQLGGLSLITGSQHGFDIALGSQVIITILVLAGWRRLALGATAVAVGYWIFSQYLIPEPLQVLSTSVYILEAAALIASPGPLRGRRLVTWRHAVVLLLAVAAVQASTFAYYRTSPILRFGGFYGGLGAPARPYVIVAGALGVAAALAAVLTRMNFYLRLLLAAAVCPWAVQLAFRLTGPGGGLLGLFTPGHLAALYLPPLLLGCGALLAAIARPGGSGASQPSEPDRPRPA